LAEATTSDLDSFEWPDPHDPARGRGSARRGPQAIRGADCALVAYRPVMLGVFEIAQQLRGMENLLEDMALRPSSAEAAVLEGPSRSSKPSLSSSWRPWASLLNGLRCWTTWAASAGL